MIKANVIRVNDFLVSYFQIIYSSARIKIKNQFQKNVSLLEVTLLLSKTFWYSTNSSYTIDIHLLLFATSHGGMTIVHNLYRISMSHSIYFKVYLPYLIKGGNLILFVNKYFIHISVQIHTIIAEHYTP